MDDPPLDSPVGLQMTVYLSYDNESELIARQVAARLKDSNITAFLKGYKSHLDISIGIEHCTIFMSLGSEALEQDRLFSNELSFALQLDKVIYPVRVQPGYVVARSFGRLLDGLYVTDLSTETARQEQLPILVASIQALLEGQHH